MSISAWNELVRRIVITGGIREDSAVQFLEQITALEYIDSSRLITVYIDTYGGNVDSCMLIYDAMRTCRCPLRTIGIGKVMSAGALILAAGDPGNRFLTKNSRIMIHQISGRTSGTLSDMENEIKEASRLHEQYVNLLAEHTKTTKTKILEDLKVDKYLTPSEAIKYGLADKIMPYVNKQDLKPKKSKK